MTDEQESVTCKMGLFKDPQAKECNQMKTPYLKRRQEMGVLGV